MKCFLLPAVLCSSLFIPAMASTLIVHDNHNIIRNLKSANGITSIIHKSGDAWRILVKDGLSDVWIDKLKQLGVKSVFKDIVSKKVSQLVEVNTTPLIDHSLLNYNDPLKTEQIEFFFGVNNIDKGLQVKSHVKKISRVVVLSTGAVPHSDLKFVGGQNFYTLNGLSQSGDYFDSWDNDSCSSGEGNAISGVLSAIKNNNIGMVGIADIKLYMARVSKPNCVDNTITTTESDVVDAINWSFGKNNDNKIQPVDVVYIAPSFKGACSVQLQDAINSASLKGVTVVVPAYDFSFGESDLVSAYAPANCSNVIVVGSHTKSGGIPNNVTTGDLIDFTVSDNFYTTGKENDYIRYSGTLISGAVATGVIATIKNIFEPISTDEIRKVIKNTSIPYPTVFNTGVDCKYGCGTGMLNFKKIVEYSKKIIDPIYSFEHSMPITETCKTTNQYNSLKTYLDVCNTVVTNIKVSYINDTNYVFNVYKQPVGVQSWFDDRVVVVNKFIPDSNKSALIINNYAPDDFNYGVSACDGDSCPFIKVLNKGDISYPTYCF